MRAELRVARRAATAIAFAMLVVLSTGTAATAHAKLVSTNPAAGSTVNGNLHAVRVTFDDVVKLVPRSLTVTGATGAPLTTAAVRLVGDRTVEAPLLDRLTPGRYFVGWRILADDGHIVSGSFSFAIAAAGATSSAGAPPPMPPAPGQPVWPVAVAAGLAVAAGIGAALVVYRGLRAVRAADALSAYPTEPLISAQSLGDDTALRH